MSLISSSIDRHADSAMMQLPQATKFKDWWGKSAEYFLKNNPWKLQNGFKFYRYCTICGDDRFTDEVWATLHKVTLYGASTMHCEKPSCYKKHVFVSGLIPDKYLCVSTEKDKARAANYQGKEFYEDIQPETVNPRSCDKVYPNEVDIPEAYADVFKRLEQFPADIRIGEIIHVYLEYKEKNGIPFHRTSLTEKNDPFLQSLARYEEINSFIYKRILAEKSLISKF